MIGCEYNGQISYITKLEDFRDLMEPTVYEALTKALESGLVWNLKEEYEELKSEYKTLEDENSSLESQCDEFESQNDSLTEENEELEKKYEAKIESIKEVISDLYNGYVKPDDVIPELEKLVEE